MQGGRPLVRGEGARWCSVVGRWRGLPSICHRPAIYPRPTPRILTAHEAPTPKRLSDSLRLRLVASAVVMSRAEIRLVARAELISEIDISERQLLRESRETRAAAAAGGAATERLLGWWLCGDGGPWGVAAAVAWIQMDCGG